MVALLQRSSTRRRRAKHHVKYDYRSMAGNYEASAAGMLR
jgi:hypothetical protein